MSAQHREPPNPHTPAPAIKHRSEHDIISLVLSSTRREGFDAGYRRALTEVLSSSVFIAEQALQETADVGDVRRTLYRFIELLEKETLRAQHDESFIEGEGI
jgi:hypothetical protein